MNINDSIMIDRDDDELFFSLNSNIGFFNDEKNIAYVGNVNRKLTNLEIKANSKHCVLLSNSTIVKNNRHLIIDEG